MIDSHSLGIIMSTDIHQLIHSYRSRLSMSLAPDHDSSCHMCMSMGVTLQQYDSVAFLGISRGVLRSRNSAKNFDTRPRTGSHAPSNRNTINLQGTR